jgi:hypothetical protein
LTVFEALEAEALMPLPPHPFALTTWRSYGNAPVIFDPHQAAMLAQRLQARGVRCTEFVSQRSASRLALTLHELIASRRLALPDDDDLRDELANLRLRETAPGVYRVDQDPDKHDDRAIALALAAQASLTHNPAPVPVLRLAKNRTPHSDPGEDYERQLAARYGPNWIMTMPF